MTDYEVLSEILKKLIEIEDRLGQLEGINVSTNSSDNRAVFYSIQNSTEKKSQHELSRQNESLTLAADLIIQHYKLQPPKRH